MAGRCGCDECGVMKILFSIIIGFSIVVLPVAYGGAGGALANEMTGCGLLLFFLAVVIVLLFKNILKRDNSFRKIRISVIDSFVICSLFYLSFNFMFIDECRTDKYVFYGWGAVIIGYLLLRSGIVVLDILLCACCVSGGIQSVIVICQRWGILSGNNIQFDITGSLGNPGQIGGYIAVCSVITLGLLGHFAGNKRTLCVWLLSAALIVQSYALFLADSRSAWVAAILGMVVVLGKNFSGIRAYCKKYRIAVIWMVCSIMFLGGIWMYKYRPASADARLLIWRVSGEMIMDKPAFGHGYSSFARDYMLYQAGFFKENPHSSFSSVADNVIYPFNEFVGITVRYGIIGLLVVVLLFSSALLACCGYLKSNIFKAALLALLLFSFFSYPTEIFPLLMFYPFLLGGIDSRIVFSFSLSYWVYGLVLMMAIAWGIYAVKDGRFLKRMSDSLSSLSAKGEDIKEDDYNKIKKNVSFNDYYMTWLSGQSDMEMKTYKRIKEIQPSCEGYCTLGKYYMAHLDYRNAEYFLNLASYMIPTRMRPKYYLWELYACRQNRSKAQEMARDILVMPLKVENSFTLKVKRRMRQYITSSPAPGFPPLP